MQEDNIKKTEKSVRRKACRTIVYTTLASLYTNQSETVNSVLSAKKAVLECKNS